MSNRLALVVVAWAAASARAQNLAWKVDGQRIDENLGLSVAFLGDVDGDGIPDVLAGGPAFPIESDSGVVVDADPLWPLSTTPRVRVLSGADGRLLLRVDGPLASAFGVSVANAGDHDGDGLDDLLVGAPLDGDGAVFVHSSATGAKLLEVRGTSTASAFGAAVADLGDLNGDGVREFAAGAPFHDSAGIMVGRAVICSGTDGSVLFEQLGTRDGGRVGMRLANAGDVDADGIDDLALVDQDINSNRDGRLDVWSGAGFGLVLSISLSNSGFTYTNDWRVASAGDVDADGHDDLIVGRPDLGAGPPGKAAAAVYSGATGNLIHSPTASPLVAGSVGGVGDFDGDGHDDYGVTGVPTSWNGAALMLFSGRTGRFRRSAPAPAPAFSSSFASGADLDGDGAGDLVVGPTDPPSWPFTGGIVQAVSIGSWGNHWQANGESRNHLGATVALHDDLDGDGFRELLIGGIGQARFVSGRTAATLRELTPPDFVFGSFGVVAALPDVDGDGVMDYAISDWSAASASGLKFAGHVEVRSGATDAVLLEVDGANGGDGLGRVLVVGVQPQSGGAGATTQMLLVTTYAYVGRLEVWDLAKNAKVFELQESSPFDWSVAEGAWIGDVDGDGVGDWSITEGALSAAGPSVRLLSGVDGSTIREFARPTGTYDKSIASGADFDGDGLPDVVVGTWRQPAPGVDVISSATGATILSLAPSDPADVEFGWPVRVLGDVNGDAVADLAVGGGQGGVDDVTVFVELRSGRDGTVLARFPGRYRGKDYGFMVGGAPGEWELLGAPTGSPRVTAGQSVNGDAIPDLVIGMGFDDGNGKDAGSVALHFLDDLLLQASPAAPFAGDTVTAATRGGVANQLAGLWLVALDGVPTLVLLDFGRLDAIGQRLVVDTVPPGASGHVLTVQAWSIGFSGRVTESQPAEISFQ